MPLAVNCLEMEFWSIPWTCFSVALVTAAVIVGSALIGTFVKSGPHIFGLAWIGVPGFVAGLVLFGWLVIGMIRSGAW